MNMSTYQGVMVDCHGNLQYYHIIKNLCELIHPLNVLQKSFLHPPGKKLGALLIIFLQQTAMSCF